MYEHAGVTLKERALAIAKARGIARARDFGDAGVPTGLPASVARRRAAGPCGARSLSACRNGMVEVP